MITNLARRLLARLRDRLSRILAGRPAVHIEGATAMISDLVRRLHEVFAGNGFNNGGEPSEIKMILSLTNGVVCRGKVIGADEWLKINKVGQEVVGTKLVDGDEQNVDGSWPDDTDLSGVDTSGMIFMTKVEFLSGGQWVSGCSIAVDSDKIIMTGDQYLAGRK